MLHFNGHELVLILWLILFVHRHKVQILDNKLVSMVGVRVTAPPAFPQGPTHRLEITPRPSRGGGGGESTVLRVSDLSDPGSTDIVVEREPPLEDKVHSLRTEVDQLKNEVS